MVDLPHYWGIVFPKMCGDPDHVFDLLGLPVAVEKLEGPCPCLSFLGFELDLEAVVIHLPLPKLAMLQHLLKSWENQQLCTGKDLESWSESRLMPAKWCSPGRLS